MKTPCMPDKMPPLNLNWEHLVPLISKANRAIARFDGTLSGMVNPEVLLSPITSQEAVLSSRIEGTIASLTEVLQHEAGDEQRDEKKRGEIKEIINYRVALLTAEQELKSRPISLHLIRALHALLMQDVRGDDRTPGAFRTTQNHIGKPGTPIEQARFIPPEPIIMQDALEDWQAFIASDYNDPLVQLAIVHAQFEIIHPFNDGNGRLGRMLIPLLLYQKEVLQRPMFYLSEYLDKTDAEYRDRLLSITEDNNWQQWIEFFLKAIWYQAGVNSQKAKQIHELYDQMKKAFVHTTRSQYAQSALDTLFSHPIINASDFLTRSRIGNRGTANSILKALTEAGLITLYRSGAGRTSAIYAFPSLINVAEGHHVFPVGVA